MPRRFHPPGLIILITFGVRYDLEASLYADFFPFLFSYLLLGQMSTATSYPNDFGVCYSLSTGHQLLHYTNQQVKFWDCLNALTEFHVRSLCAGC